MSKLTQKMIAEASKPRQVAVYAHLTREDHFSVFEVQYETHDEHWQKLPEGVLIECTRSDFVRISEITTVVCRPVAEDEITQNAVASLDKQAKLLSEEYYEQIGKINGMKKQLLAITYQPEPQAHPGEVIVQAGEGGNAGGEVVFDPPPSYSGDSQGSVFDVPVIEPAPETECVDEGCPHYGTQHSHMDDIPF